MTNKHTMKQEQISPLFAVAWLTAAFPGSLPAADSLQPLAAADLSFEEVNGVVAIEAEHFYKLTLTGVRAWHIASSKAAPDVKPDGDPAHLAGASGGAYVECLPDTRVTSKNKLISGENYSNEPGKMAVLHYRVHFNTPGRYYVWVRAYSSGAEDNSVHVGLDGQWPESGQRLQWCEGKNSWRWESKQRTEQEHCGEPYKIYLEVEKAGAHEILFSMREDGFEFDKFILTLNREFVRPEDGGPAPRVKSGKLPPAFAAVAAPKPSFPAHWGQPPEIQTMDYRPLPGGYGFGSSTLAAWIQRNLDKDAASASGALALSAQDLMFAAEGYYLDKGKWLAINPGKNKAAKAQTAFPFPSGRYDVTLQAVGESVGRSTYQMAVNDSRIGDFTCPLSTETFEEGAKFATTWKNIELNSGDIILLSSQVGSEDGQEFSRARVAKLSFSAADEPTKAAVAKMAATKPVAEAPKPAGPPLVQPRRPDGAGQVEVTGELKQWHKVTLTLDGPFAQERDNEPNPFTDYCMTVTFAHESGTPKYAVPGYFAADGNAVNTSAESGTKWRAHLSPDKVGKWNYSVSFAKGRFAAVSDAKGQALKPFDGRTGSFTTAASDKAGRDFRTKGYLQYVGKHHLQFAGSKEYFLKAGPDAPENLLGYTDFDGTRANKRRNTRNGEATPGSNLKTWQPHVKDWQPGDPTWKDGKGKGLIGALNYLSGKGCNVFSFLTYNAGGDGDDVWPFVEREDKLHYDCSKLDQWGIVFDHGTARGLYLHFKMQENEIDDNRRGSSGEQSVVPESLDGGKLGPERRLYCRELIARFAHNLALNWNIGEENTQSTEEVRDMARYLHDTDPYQHNIVIHTFPPQQEKVYPPLLGDQSALTGASLQNGWSMAHQRTLKWLTESAKAGKPWVVCNDEQNPASLGVPPDPGYQGHDGVAREDAAGGEGKAGKKAKKEAKKESTAPAQGYTMHDIRKLCLWGTLMAGGAGVEYYFGYKLPQNDLVCEDFRSRDRSWDFCRIALSFFKDNVVPFWEMKNADALVGNGQNDNSKYCLAKPGELYVVYLPNGGTTDLDLAGANGAFTVKWFNPRVGGVLQEGSVKSVKGGATVSLGQPPAETDQDWTALIKK